jgi:hypothetical protein
VVAVILGRRNAVKTIRWFVIATAAVLLVATASLLTLAVPGRADPDPDFSSGPGSLTTADANPGTVKSAFLGPVGDLSTGAWEVIVTGLDLTDVQMDSEAGGWGGYVNVSMQDRGTGSGWESFPIQIHDAAQTAKRSWLFQAFDLAWSIQRSHQTNAELNDTLDPEKQTFDLRVVLQDLGPAAGYRITNWLRQHASDGTNPTVWQLFWDTKQNGPYSTSGHDFTNFHVAIDIVNGPQSGSTHTVSWENVEVRELTTAVVVDDDGLATPDDCDSDVPTLYDKIQKAVNAALSGDTILVCPGTYNETLKLDSTKASDLSVIGADAANTFLTGGIRFEGNYDGLTVENFTITGDGRQRPGLSQATVGDSSSLVTVTNARFADNVFDGENVADRFSLYLDRLSGSFTFEGNEVKNYEGWGTLDLNQTYNPVASYAFNDNNIHDNKGSTALRGSSSDRTDTVTATGNVFDNNGGGDSWASLEINEADTATVSDNSITNTQAGSWGEGEALQFWHITSLTVTGNTIENNYQGIYFPGDPWSSDLSGVEIHSNSISGNTQFGFKAEAGNTGTADAENNWWGSVNGPTHASNTFNVGSQGDAVSDNVDFVPWLNAAGGASFAPVTTTSPEGSYASIQAGIDFSNPSGTVNAASGTFDEAHSSTEDIYIDKALTLSGAGSASTIVQSSEYNNPAGSHQNGLYITASDVTVEELKLTKKPGAPYASGYNIHTVGALSNVTLRDVESEYSQSTNVFVDGAYTYSNLVLEDCNIHHSGWVGLYESPSTTVNGMTITNSHFDYANQIAPLDDKGGVALFGHTTNLEITGGTYNENKGVGISLQGITGATISDVEIYHSGYGSNSLQGLAIYEGEDSSSDIAIINPTVTNSGGSEGILLGASPYAGVTVGTTLSDVTVRGGSISGSGGPNLTVFVGRFPGATVGGSVSNVLIQDVTLTQGNYYGLYVLKGSGTGAAATHLSNITLDGVTVNSNHGNPYQGLFIHSQEGPLDNVTIKDCVVRDTGGSGITVQAGTTTPAPAVVSNVQITGCQVDNPLGQSVEFLAQRGGTILGSNSVTNCTMTNTPSGKADVYFWAGDNLPGRTTLDLSYFQVHGNNFQGSGYGVMTLGNNQGKVINVVDATNNWWSSPNGPTHPSNTYNVGAQGLLSSDQVTFVPWLDAAPPGGASFAPVTTTDPVGSFASIQAGANASNPGGTVNAKAGTFTEQPDIAKALILTGAGQASTIIKSPAALATKFANNKPVMYIHDASGVTVQQLTVDGDGKGNANYRMEGIAFYNAGGTVDRVTITRVRETPLSGAQHGVALYAYNADAVPRTLNVSNNTIDEYQKNGMALSGGGLTVTVTHNTVTGAGPTGVTAQNGIQVGFGATGTVDHNTVSNNSYTGDYWGASGILVTSSADWGYPPSSADVASNVVTDDQVGIYYGEGSGTASGNIVSASAAGVGMPAFWGVVVSDPAGHAASPFEDGAAAPAGGGGAMAPMGAGVMTVVVSDNTLTGDGSVDSVGLEADAGYLPYGAEDVAFTASGNTISNWGTGVAVAQCVEDCNTGVFVSVDVGPDNNVSVPIADPANSGLHAMGSVNLNVHDNTFTGGHDAIKLRLSVTGTVKDNVVSGYAKNGITVGKYADDNTGTNVTVSGNTVTGGGAGKVNAQNGIQVGPNAVASIENNTVSNHVYTLGPGDCAGPGTKGDKVYYDACYTAAGIIMYQGTATVTGNVITGNQVGIDDSGAVVHYNEIRDNIIYGENNVSAGIADAKNNWWGSCSGPSHSTNPLGTGDAVSDNVDFDPWITGPCDTDGDGLADDQETLVIGTDWQDADTDGDGCRDGREYLFMPGFDPRAPYWYDVYDVPVPANPDPSPNGPKNRTVNIGDVLAVLLYAFAKDGGPPNGNGVDYDSVKGSCDVGGDTVPDEEGMCYDRTPSAIPNPPWEAGPPNGVINMSDVLTALAQVFVVDCSGSP